MDPDNGDVTSERCDVRGFFPLIGVLVPLALVQFGTDLSEQSVNTVISRGSTDASPAVLSAFTSSFFIAKFAAGGMLFMRPLALVPVETREDVKLATTIFIVLAAFFTCLMVFIALSPVGVLVSGVPDSGAVCRAFLASSLIPATDGCYRFLQGLLLRRRLVSWCTFGALVDVSCMAITTILVIKFGKVSPSYVQFLAVVPLYVGRAAHLSVLSLGLIRHPNYLTRGRDESELMAINAARDAEGVVVETNNGLTLSFAVKFAYPLMLADLAQRLSRPVVNGFVAHTQGPSALATLGLLYPLGHMCYGWLNNLKVMEPSFIDKPQMRERIAWFAPICMCFSIAWSFTMTLSGANFWILSKIAPSKNFSSDATTFIPLMVFATMGLPVGTRGFLTGKMTADQRTETLVFSGIIRIPGIIAALSVAIALGVRGATVGVIGLFAGFATQSLGIIVGMFMCPKSRSRVYEGDYEGLENDYKREDDESNGICASTEVDVNPKLSKLTAESTLLENGQTQRFS